MSISFNEYQKQAKATKIPLTEPGVSSDQHWCLGLITEVGEVAGKIHKRYRDPDPIDYEEYKKGIKAELGDVLWELAILADVFGFALEEIAEENIAKLKSRKSRGKIHGSGDNR